MNYRQVFAGFPCWIRDRTGACRPLQVGRYLGGKESTSADRLADLTLLGLCTGRTVDLGCGPGRFTAALAARGTRSLGVDSCAVAVQMTIRRGGQALHQDLFCPLPGPGSWARVLLADGNVGLGGEPVRTLRRARELLAPGGLVVAEVDPPSTGIHCEYLRWETPHSVGRWYRWARIGTDAVHRVAAAAGLHVASVIETSGRFVVTMQVIEPAACGVRSDRD
ncbi:class I SAM-dependent DNA methyltransferase [Nocardia sp. NPDC058519]|uniref:class I SAM-dependent DNA methyltransferase n=1 Tax=Nocardia sp. NPDC058519 TaxID=3346535 RepID=UPI0036491ED0